MELLQLVVIALGGDLDGGISFRSPGDTSDARWMAKAIYSIKMFLFRKQAKFSEQVEENLLQITMFVLKVYAKAWFSATDALAAPRNDVNFLQSLVQYKSVNNDLVTVALQRFSEHLWYLGEQNIGISIFDEELSLEMRQAVLDGILNREKEVIPPKQHSKKRVIQLEDIPSLNVGKLTTQRSREFFDILGIDTSFFEIPISEWKDNLHYKHGKKLI